MILKKRWIKMWKIMRNIVLVTMAVILIFLLVRLGRAINNRTPEGGINESMYVEINGTQQWINIYGKDINNPVLLYLHGGPGSSTSAYEYAFTRKWADVYTVLTWDLLLHGIREDQRNCGKSYEKSQNDTVLTYELMMNWQ